MLESTDALTVTHKNIPVVIIGSGIAGLLTAIKLSEAGIPSLVVTKTLLTENSSRMAQGGIAAVLPDNQQDSLELHIQDTLAAGAGLADEAVARSILQEGQFAIEDLLHLGVPFDKVGGKLAFTKEAAHSTQRILHAGGDATGRSIQDTLIARVQQDPLITVFEECIALQLLMRDNRCIGVQVVRYTQPQALERMTLLARQTILATGGIGRLYAQTTNPPIATGDGVALAYFANALIQDMEFVQFHPTAFWADGRVHFLISEALRGEGGILRNKAGVAFAKDYHPQGELAPRDIVTRAISTQCLKDNRPYVLLDITHLPQETIEGRFPNILQACLQFGIDIRRDPIPVAPAAHYGMGGVWVDPYGQTTIQGLYAVGEVASSGLHGANRLASNSLLECVVLARRVASRVQQEIPFSPSATLTDNDPQLAVYPLQYGHPVILNELTLTLRDLMWAQVGILRDKPGLTAALSRLTQLEEEAMRHHVLTYVPHGVEFRNMLVASRLICEAALQREESRGAHYRIDYPETAPHAVHSRQQRSLEEDRIPHVYATR